MLLHTENIQGKRKLWAAELSLTIKAQSLFQWEKNTYKKTSTPLNWCAFFEPHLSHIFSLNRYKFTQFTHKNMVRPYF